MNEIEWTCFFWGGGVIKGFQVSHKPNPFDFRGCNALNQSSVMFFGGFTVALLEFAGV